MPCEVLAWKTGSKVMRGGFVNVRPVGEKWGGEEVKKSRLAIATVTDADVAEVKPFVLEHSNELDPYSGARYVLPDGEVDRFDGGRYTFDELKARLFDRKAAAQR